jgi:hypothetical protein
MTPAMASGLTERVWDMADIVALIEQAEAVPSLNVERTALSQTATLPASARSGTLP